MYIVPEECAQRNGTTTSLGCCSCVGCLFVSVYSIEPLACRLSCSFSQSESREREHITRMSTSASQTKLGHVDISLNLNSLVFVYSKRRKIRERRQSKQTEWISNGSKTFLCLNQTSLLWHTRLVGAKIYYITIPKFVIRIKSVLSCFFFVVVTVCHIFTISFSNNGIHNLVNFNCIPARDRIPMWYSQIYTQ